ncbi:transcription factor WRKY19-like isoform X2 [Phragmites australis]|uniref:transcription factor WRKY19-like isoform X2 n=1 Tax=Phragmites australis TaxID=29695 RepID=UPI002D7703E2|nr:transcription factor WRKY19-like isoform X2 [Phragmites australis]
MSLPGNKKPVQRFEQWSSVALFQLINTLLPCRYHTRQAHTGNCLEEELSLAGKDMESMDACGGGKKRALTSELAQVLAMVRELEARMDQDLPVAARELCGALASSIDRSIRIARSCWPEPESPESGDWSAQNRAGGGNARKDAQFKRRKGVPSVRRQVRATSVQDMTALNDGLSWRKYGQKDILGAKYPRAYFRCRHRHTQDCYATKQVQCVDGDPLLYDVVYHGAHTCAQAAHPSAEQLQPGNAGQEQSLMSARETEGLQAGLESMTPFSGNDNGAIGGGFLPLLSPTSLECPFRSSYAAGDLGVDMELEPQFEEFFWNPTESFQW